MSILIINVLIILMWIGIFLSTVTTVQPLFLVYHVSAFPFAVSVIILSSAVETLKSTINNHTISPSNNKYSCTLRHSISAIEHTSLDGAVWSCIHQKILWTKFFLAQIPNTAQKAFNIWEPMIKVTITFPNTLIEDIPSFFKSWH